MSIDDHDYVRLVNFSHLKTESLQMQYLAHYIAYEIWARRVTGEREGRRLVTAMQHRVTKRHREIQEWYEVRCLIVHGEAVDFERVEQARQSLGDFLGGIIQKLVTSDSWHVDRPEIARYILML